MQVFFDRERLEREPILGAVGRLQFEVIQYRLKSEYDVDGALRAAAVAARPLGRRAASIPPSSSARRRARACSTSSGRPLVLFENDFWLRQTLERHAQLRFIAAVQPGRSERAAA